MMNAKEYGKTINTVRFADFPRQSLILLFVDFATIK